MDMRLPPPVVNIICFIVALTCSAFLAYHADDVWFYDAHNPQGLKVSTGFITFVVINISVIVFQSGLKRKLKERFVMSLFGGLLGLMVVVSYALFR